MTSVAATETVPLSFVEPQPQLPHRVKEIHYGLLSASDTHRLSVLPCRRVMGNVREYGINDLHLGTCERSAVCATCGKSNVDCVGHAGHIDLEMPVFHLGFFTAVVRICRTICKRCSHVLLTPEEKEYYRRRFLARNLEPSRFADLMKSVQEDAYKTRVCLNCGGINGAVKKLRPLRLVHEKYCVKLRRGEEGCKDESLLDVVGQLSTASKHNAEVNTSKGNIQEFLNPARVKELFLAIPESDILLLGMRPGAHPVDLLMTTLLVPPVSVRPRGPSGVGGGIREDELTIQYNDILASSEALREGTLDPTKYVETWELLQARAARLLDSALPGFPQHMRIGEGKSYAQRMKGKHGRFRGNLSGKRVDFSGRSVISPDPNLGVDELAVPLHVARVLTYPQRVFSHNIDFMRRLVRNGPLVHPGAVTVYFARDGSRKSLHYDRESIAARLAIGDVVERHVMNGDLILFNRQPSLHRISMMCHRARVLPFRTFRFNECCCAPYNADFDGDEMNVHLVQTEEAKAEALTLMSTAKNIITAKNGEPIIACTQDFLTASYLVTSRDVFLDRAQFTQCVMHWLGCETREATAVGLNKGGGMDTSLARSNTGAAMTFDMPIPAILKPVELWTGKQLYEVLLCPQRSDNVLLSFEATTKSYSGSGKQDCAEEGYVSVLESKVISGRLDKKLLGGGAKDGLFARLHALTGGDYTAAVMSRIARFTSRYLSNYGFSLGLGDVSPTPSLNARKALVLERSFETCDNLISSAASGQMEPLPGMTIRQSLEARLNGELSKVRDECGSAAVETLSRWSNAPLIMSQSGSKGSALNIAQMMACVGQQTVSGKRISNSFIDRSLPHFPRFAEHPGARGFVANSFFSGLTPTEFFFHTMAGREGLVDTAVKTAETGYIYRRLMKAMENMSVAYDGTVRNSKKDIIQLRFGEDGLDPQLMEGNAGSPLNFEQEWIATLATYWRRVQERLRNVSLNQTQKNGRIINEAENLQRDATTDAALFSLPPTEVLPFVDECMAKRIPLFSSTSSRFQADVRRFFEMKAALQNKVRAQMHIPEGEVPAGNGTDCALGSADDAPSRSLRELMQTKVVPLTKEMIQLFLSTCVRKYVGKQCEPGTPCGAIAAQSVGEPSTQMTLRTFHFAGVASMSITQGVPRLVEIINANRSIATPIVTAPLLLSKRAWLRRCGGSSNDELRNVSDSDEVSGKELVALARNTKARMERVLLKEVTSQMVEVITQNDVYLRIELNMKLVRALQLPINAETVRTSILAVAARPMSPLRHLRADDICVTSIGVLRVNPSESSRARLLFSLKDLLVLLPDIIVGGIAGINRAIITKKGREIIAEGAELRSVMNLDNVDGEKVTSNHVAAIEKVLGIEAARNAIVSEILSIMKAYSLSIDIRHIYLLADVMTHRGVVLGITRYGIQKMNNGVLTMASFERTMEHLYNAAMTQRTDKDLSVSDNVIVGSPIPLGTNSFQLLQAKGKHVLRSSARAESTKTTKTVKDDVVTAAVFNALGSEAARYPHDDHHRLNKTDTPASANGASVEKNTTQQRHEFLADLMSAYMSSQSCRGSARGAASLSSTRMLPAPLAADGGFHLDLFS